MLSGAAQAGVSSCASQNFPAQWALTSGDSPIRHQRPWAYFLREKRAYPSESPTRSLGPVAQERVRTGGWDGTSALQSFSSCFPISPCWSPMRPGKQASIPDLCFLPGWIWHQKLMPCVVLCGCTVAGPPLLWGQDGVAQSRTCGHHLGISDCKR